MVSIIIPTCAQTLQMIKPCLESIVKYSTLSEIEIVVNSNGANQEVNDFLIEFKKTEGLKMKILFSPEKGGYTRSVNQALAISDTKSEFLIIQNDDTELLIQAKDDWINLLKAPFLADSQTAISGPHQIFDPQLNDFFLVGFLIMVSRSFMAKFGAYDEVFQPGSSEDCDLSLRAHCHGFKTPLASVNTGESGRYMIGSYPIYHYGEFTMDIPEIDAWVRPFAIRNYQLLLERKRSGFYSLPFKFPSTVPFLAPLQKD